MDGIHVPSDFTSSEFLALRADHAHCDDHNGRNHCNSHGDEEEKAK